MTRSIVLTLTGRIVSTTMKMTTSKSTWASLVALSLYSPLTFSQPVISQVTGQLAHDGAVTISGSNFGIRRNDLQLIHDDFENAQFDPNWTTTFSNSIGSDFQRNSNSQFSARGRFQDYHTVGFKGGSNSDKWFIQYWFRLSNNFQWGRGSDGNAAMGNVKFIRLWDTGSDRGNIVGAYHTYNNQNNALMTNEGLGGPRQVRIGEPPVAPLGLEGSWHLQQFEFVDSSSVNSADATFKWWFDGQRVYEHLGFVGRNSSNQNFKRPFIVGFYNSWNSAGVPDGTTLYLDNVYIANTLARVEIGDRPSYEDCTIRELQPVSSWSPNSIEITVEQGSFPSLNSAFLFVVNTDGSVSRGYQLCTGSCPKPPILE